MKQFDYLESSSEGKGTMSFTKDDSARIKGIAIILLIFHHLCYRASLFEQYGMKTMLPERYVVDLAVLSRLCVYMFVFVSAYGLASIYVKNKDPESTGRFIAKRWVSLMAAWWFAYPFQIILFLLTGGNISDTFKGKYHALFLDIMGWGDFFDTPMVAGVNWYMGVAQLILVMTPLLCLFTRKFKSLSLIYALVAIQILQGVKVSARGGDYANYLFTVVLGNYLATNNSFAKFKVRRPVLVSLSSVGLFILFMAGRYDISKHASKHLAFSTALLACAVVALGVFVSTAMRKDVVFRFLGVYSGNIYFLHIFIIKVPIIHKYVSNVPLLVLITLLISLALSLMIELLKKAVRYEKLIKWAQSRIDNRKMISEAK